MSKKKPYKKVVPSFEVLVRIRAATGAGAIDCKKAFCECDGDEQATIKYLKEHSGARSI